MRNKPGGYIFNAISSDNCPGVTVSQITRFAERFQVTSRHYHPTPSVLPCLWRSIGTCGYYGNGCSTNSLRLVPLLPPIRFAGGTLNLSATPVGGTNEGVYTVKALMPVTRVRED
ncbi:MAG: hypothetical protein IPN22_05870 [Bacteroidetes bacterium]|nr:hypothetical protein [Bacteroidota bacterium]